MQSAVAHLAPAVCCSVSRFKAFKLVCSNVDGRVHMLDPLAHFGIACSTIFSKNCLILIIIIFSSTSLLLTCLTSHNINCGCGLQ